MKHKTGMIIGISFDLALCSAVLSFLAGTLYGHCHAREVIPILYIVMIGIIIAHVVTLVCVCFQKSPSEQDVKQEIVLSALDHIGDPEIQNLTITKGNDTLIQIEKNQTKTGKGKK